MAADMGDLNTPPAEAYAPDPDRADQDSPDLMPEWLAYLIALVILFIIETFQNLPQRPKRRPAPHPVGQPALPRNPTEKPATTIRSQPDNAIARTRGARAVAPNCLELSRARASLLEKLRHSDVDPAMLSQLEALGIVPGLTDPDTAAAPLPSPLCAAKIRRDPRGLAPARPRHAVSLAPWRQMLARASTGPPTGPPAVSRHQSCYA
ncbi:MAG TPA: hypothetical protein VGG99_02045 [Acetobacteraceae bacterium]|jgi:hypothetical protein